MPIFLHACASLLEALGKACLSGQAVRIYRSDVDPGRGPWCLELCVLLDKDDLALTSTIVFCPYCGTQLNGEG